MHRHRPVPVSEKAQVKAGLTVPLWPALLFCLYRLFHFLLLHYVPSINTDLLFSERSGEDRSEWRLIQLDLDHLLSLFLIEYKDIALRMRI